MKSSVGRQNNRVSYRHESDSGDPLLYFASTSDNEQENSERNGGNIDFIFGEITEQEVASLAKYDDFDTIDWTRDRQQDRVRLRRMKKMKRGTCLEKLLEAHDAW